MEIIIAGAGSVGFRLAKVLSLRHNVVIMDRNTEALEKLKESIDVLPIAGNVQDPDAYEPLSGREFDLFIAVTDIDEVNLIAAGVAVEKLRAARKIVRLSHTFFSRSTIAQRLAVEHAVFPHILTAESVRSLLDQPKANNVKSFPGTEMKLVSVKADFHHGVKGMAVSQVESRNLAVIGIERKKNYHLPSASAEIRQDEMVYLFGAEEAIREQCGRLNHAMPRSIRNIVIFGAGSLGIEIALKLGERDTVIKLVEKDLECCRGAAERLQGKAMVINSKYGDSRLYRDEGLGHAEMMIAATPNDEENIIKCIEAREHGVGKVVAINNDIAYYHLMHALGIIVVRGPKVNAFYSILEIIGSSAVVNEKLFCGGAAICFLRHFSAARPGIEAPKHRMFAVYRIRGEQIETVEAADAEAGDAVVLVCDRAHEEEGRAWINAL